MYKKILIFCLSAGVLFTSCQSDSVSEEIQSEEFLIAKEKTANDVNAKWHFPDYMEGPQAETSEPSWSTGPTPAWHTPDWTIEAAEEACSGDIYSGPANLTVNPSSELVSFTSGQEHCIKLTNLNVGGKLAFCGFMTVKNSVNIRRSAEFGVSGGMYIGTEETPANLVINRGSHFHVSGQIIVTGDLIINPYAEINLYGEDGPVFIVGGDILIDEKAEIYDHRTEGDDHDHDHEN